MAKKSIVKKKAAKKTAKKAAGKTAKKTVKKAAKKVAKKTIKKAVKKAVEKTVKKAPAMPAKKKAKSRLSKAELAEFRAILLEKRRDLVGDMNGIEAEALRKGRHDVSSDLSTLPTHPADVGTDNFEQEFTLGLLESERVLLNKISAALQRIENGTYGMCLGTGKPITKARLRARPWSRYCIAYAENLEKGLVTPDSEGEQEHQD